MDAELPRYPFTAWAILGSPDEAGVYILWEGNELTYVGRANGGSTIRSCLLEHFEKHRTCPCTPTHYAWKLARDVHLGERELLLRYREQHATLPRCNRAEA